LLLGFCHVVALLADGTWLALCAWLVGWLFVVGRAVEDCDCEPNITRFVTVKRVFEYTVFFLGVGQTKSTAQVHANAVKLCEYKVDVLRINGSTYYSNTS
jgi:hypothetical protein